MTLAVVLGPRNCPERARADRHHQTGGIDMTPSATSTTTKRFLGMLLGLGLAANAGTRSSHSEPRPSAAHSVREKSSHLAPPPRTPAVCETSNLPPAARAKAPSRGTAAKSTVAAVTAPAEPFTGCNGCGSNSPDINAFTFNGLHLDGCTNADGDRLVVESFQRGASNCDVGGTEPLFLGIESRNLDDAGPAQRGHENKTGYQLVAKDRKGATRCHGGELAGATFEVDSPQRGRAKLLISHVAETSVCHASALPAPRALPAPSSGKSLKRFTRELAKHNRGFETLTDSADLKNLLLLGDVTDCADHRVTRVKRTVYLITREDQPNHSLCTHNYYNDQQVESSQTPQRDVPYAIPRVYASRSLWPVMKEELPLYSVIIPGAVFDNSGDLIGRSNEARWFNIACAGDALAKTDLSGLVPLPQAAKPDDVERRLPALHMFSAKYAGGVSATNNGTPLAWEPVAWQWEDNVSIERFNQQLHDLKALFMKNAITRSDRYKQDPGEHASQPTRGSYEPEHHVAIEARWNRNGATCLCHSRIWMPNRMIPIPEQMRARWRGRGDRGPVTVLLRSEASFNESLTSVAACDLSRSSSELTSFALGHIEHGTGDPSPCDQAPR